MAVIVGESGAWKRIAANLARHGHSVSAPNELFPLLSRLEELRPTLIEAHHAQTMLSVSLKNRLVQKIEAERSFIKRVFNWFRIRACKSDIKVLLAKHRGYSAGLDQQIAAVRALIDSAEFVGAQAEIDVIDRLRELPSPAVVFNDVQLRASRRILFNGKPLASAQLDHVVLTSSGVFIVETKRWSSGFVRSGAYFDPYEQVQRANYLCYDLLLRRFGKTRVRSIIACAGSLPDAPRDSYVTVIRPEHLANFLSAFRGDALAPDRFNDLSRFFALASGTLL